MIFISIIWFHIFLDIVFPVVRDMFNHFSIGIIDPNLPIEREKDVENKLAHFVKQLFRKNKHVIRKIMVRVEHFHRVT